MNETQIEKVEKVEVVEILPVKNDDMLSLVKEAERPVFHAMSNLTSLDWRNLQPNQMAFLLTQKPFPVSGGGTTYLTFRQALLFALRCYELGVSPLSSEVWFDPARGSTNLTLEGKKAVARNKGIDLGPPQFTDLSREWSELPKNNNNVDDLKKAGFSKDLGIKCRVRVGKPEHQEFSEYTAWLSEWYVSRSPVWAAKSMHMLQTRAYEKCLCRLKLLHLVA